MFWRQGVCNRKDEKACVVLVQQTDNCSLILVRYLRWHDICHRIRSNSACHGKVDAYPSVNLIQHWIPGTMAYRHSRLVESREGVASSRCHRNVWVLVHWMAFVCIHCEWRVEDWVSLAGWTCTHLEPPYFFCNMNLPTVIAPFFYRHHRSASPAALGTLLPIVFC
jgi:hypothetical protein